MTRHGNGGAGPGGGGAKPYSSRSAAAASSSPISTSTSSRLRAQRTSCSREAGEAKPSCFRHSSPSATSSRALRRLPMALCNSPSWPIESIRDAPPRERLAQQRQRGRRVPLEVEEVAVVGHCVQRVGVPGAARLAQPGSGLHEECLGTRQPARVEVEHRQPVHHVERLRVLGPDYGAQPGERLLEHRQRGGEVAQLLQQRA
eukprot:scaffold98814_cov73-Phaeocystis_antarctica.AAC.3